ncbi:hypothetical protein AAHE18_06G158600 [Arachis hypogaea]
MVVIMFFFVVSFAFGQLRVGFYRSSCPKVELIVKQQGCDASILIDSPSNTSDKSTVSCADIITLATRDAVAFSGGPKYAIPTGRRDGLVSNNSDVDIPRASAPVQFISQFFANKGMTVEEMVVLLGPHSVGVAHCVSFQRMLLSFNGKHDPTMDPALDSKLVKVCNPKAGRVQVSPPSAFLDLNTSFIVDNEFYKQILLNRGVLQIDQELALDSSTKDFVSSFAVNGDKFQKSFADAMIKMGKIEILVGNDGEIRKTCRVFN